MRKLPKLDKRKYNSKKKYYQQGDDWDWIFKEYSLYVNKTKNFGKYSTLQRWVREKSIPAPNFDCEMDF